MSRLAIPVQGQLLYATGDVKLSVEVFLWVRDGAGNFGRHRFLVDNGTEITTFPAFEARQMGLVVPPRPAPVRHEQTGLEVRSGQLAFRIDGMDATLYAVPCLYLGDPTAPPARGAVKGVLARKLLQPLALLNVLRFWADKDPLAVGAPHGEWVFEKR